MMVPELTHEQRTAIDQRQGKPVYVIDSARHETFVLLTSSDFDKVRPMLSNEFSGGTWDDEKDCRRIELIDKRISKTITPDELVELTILQQQAETHFDKVASPPMNGVRELHQQLLDRRDSHQ
jgi:hypothetical protein